MGFKYIKVVLRLITWTDKKTNEEDSCYAFTNSQAQQVECFGESMSGSLNIRVGGKRVNAPASDVTVWMNDMTSDEIELYQQSGKDTAYVGIQGDLSNPTSTKIISEQEFQQLQEPSMLFASAS